MVSAKNGASRQRGFPGEGDEGMAHGIDIEGRIAIEGQTVPQNAAGLSAQPAAQHPETAHGHSHDQESHQLPRVGNLSFLARLLDPPAGWRFCSLEIALFSQ